MSAGCADLGALLGKRLKGRADVKALGRVLAAKLCGKTAPAGAADVLARLGLGAAGGAARRAGAELAAAGGEPAHAPGRRRRSGADADGHAGGRVASAPATNGVDNDGDGQTDWEDPGCSDAGDMTENTEVPVSAECAASSGVGMGDDPTWLGAGINSGCGTFTRSRSTSRPGVAACIAANNGFDVRGLRPDRRAPRCDEQARPTWSTSTSQLKAPVDCAKPATIALYRPNGEVAELREPVGNCETLPPPAPKCNNGKDDDGDGLVDSRDSAGTTDPDPGCSGVADTTENSEMPTPASCEVQVGLFGGDKRFAGAGDLGLRRAQGRLVPPAGDADRLPVRVRRRRRAGVLGHKPARRARRSRSPTRTSRSGPT